jgi:hypothetical protein
MTVDTGDITTPLYDSGLLTGRTAARRRQITFARVGGAANYGSDLELDDVTLDYPASTFMPSAIPPTASAGTVSTAARRSPSTSPAVSPRTRRAITQTAGTTHPATLIDSNISVGTEGGGYVTYEVDQDATVDSVYSVTFTGADGGVSAPSRDDPAPAGRHDDRRVVGEDLGRQLPGVAVLAGVTAGLLATQRGGDDVYEVDQ